MLFILRSCKSKMKIGLTFNNEQKSNIILLNFTLKSGKKTAGLECCIGRPQLAIGVNKITSSSTVSIRPVFSYCVNFLVGPNFQLNFQAHSSISIALLSLTIASSAGNFFCNGYIDRDESERISLHHNSPISH